MFGFLKRITKGIGEGFKYAKRGVVAVLPFARTILDLTGNKRAARIAATLNQIAVITSLQRKDSPMTLTAPVNPSKVITLQGLIDDYFQQAGFKEILAKFQGLKFPPFRLSFGWLYDVSAEANEALALGYEFAKAVTWVIEKVGTDGQELFTSEEKQAAAVAYIDEKIKLRGFLEMVDGLIIAAAVNEIVKQYNAQEGKAWITKVPAPVKEAA